MTIHITFLVYRPRKVKTANSFSTERYCNKQIIYEKVLQPLIISGSEMLIEN